MYCNGLKLWISNFKICIDKSRRIKLKVVKNVCWSRLTNDTKKCFTRWFYQNKTWRGLLKVDASRLLNRKSFYHGLIGTAQKMKFSIKDFFLINVTKSAGNYFHSKTPSQMLDMVLNTPLKYISLLSSCNLLLVRVFLTYFDVNFFSLKV